jgi:type II secretory pathway component PulK
MALIEGLDESRVRALIATREKKPFDSVQSFLTHEVLAGLKIEAKNLAVTSNYFLLTTVVQIDRAQIQLRSLFYRLPPSLEVIMRSRGEM